MKNSLPKTPSCEFDGCSTGAATKMKFGVRWADVEDPSDMGPPVVYSEVQLLCDTHAARVRDEFVFVKALPIDKVPQLRVKTA